MLKATALHCKRGGRLLFQDLNLSIQGQDLIRVSGANGSGKTSLLRILCGLLTPDAGEVRWKGTAIGALREEYTRELVYLGHAPAVKDDLTAAENLNYASVVSGLGVSRERIPFALEKFGVSGDSLIKKLSQGQRRRAALARLTLSGSVPLWLLDEPFAALDATAAGLVEELIRAHAAGGGAVVFTTHQDTQVAATRTVELHG
ncbi:MAG TPA: cytochrome c biogenesis heme-transporting ATPase CcmA [Burkholderiales bacterium]